MLYIIIAFVWDLSEDLEKFLASIVVTVLIMATAIVLKNNSVFCFFFKQAWYNLSLPQKWSALDFSFITNIMPVDWHSSQARPSSMFRASLLGLFLLLKGKKSFSSNRATCLINFQNPKHLQSLLPERWMDTYLCFFGTQPSPHFLGFITMLLGIHWLDWAARVILCSSNLICLSPNSLLFSKNRLKF